MLWVMTMVILDVLMCVLEVGHNHKWFQLKKRPEQSGGSAAVTQEGQNTVT